MPSYTSKITKAELVHALIVGGKTFPTLFIAKKVLLVTLATLQFYFD